ncbi:MAG: hypothetical protein ACRYFK_07455 [Janthinobacterium lividum]
MATTPDDPPHIFKAKQAAAEQGLDLVAAFSALNLAAEFYRQEPAPPAAPAPDAADVDKLRRILRNARRHLRSLHEVLAAEDIPDAKKVKKIRFLANLLLPNGEQMPPKISA